MGRILAAVSTLALAAVLLASCWPQLLGMQQWPLISQLVAMRGLSILVAVLVALLLGLLALLSARARRYFAGLAVLLLAFAIVTTGVLAVRGLSAGSLQTKAQADLVVLSWNTLGDAPGAPAIAELALAQEADVIALPETSEGAGLEIAALLEAGGRPMQVISLRLDDVSKARSTVLLVSESLGEYRRVDDVGTTETLPSLVAVPTDGTGPTLVAAHPVAPVPGEFDAWRTGLDWLADRCADPDASVIVAGDLNSTLDHWAGYGSETGLAHCHDAARAAGSAAVGTWPAIMPPLLGSPIDHVLATDAYEVVGFRVIESADGAGSDHRPIVAQLRPTGS